MNIVLLGPPGSGKGTQAKRIAETQGLKHVSTGEVFREEIARKSPLGLKVESFVKSGLLVPDEVVIEVLASKLDAMSGSFLLDGFPRTVEQAKALDAYLGRAGRKIDGVVYIAVPNDEVVRRLGSRWTCTKCNEVYNLVSRPPKAEGVCDKDGAPLYQRADDKPESVQKRLVEYDKLTKPLVEYYRSGQAFHEVDGTARPDDVFAAIQLRLGNGSPLSSAKGHHAVLAPRPASEPSRPARARKGAKAKGKPKAKAKKASKRRGSR